MKLTQLRINDFRGIREMVLDFDEQLNVLVGVNGSGKSSILDCLAICLSWMLNRIRTPNASGRHFSETDIRNQATYAQAEIHIQISDLPCQWTIVKSRKGQTKPSESNFLDLRNLVEVVRSEVPRNPQLSLPLAVYYDIHRAVLDIPLRIRKRASLDDPLSSYDGALDSASTQFRTFFAWFREREDVENERFRLQVPSDDAAALRRNRSLPGDDLQLTAVRQAIHAFLPGFSTLRVRRSPLRMTLSKGREELRVDQLSDGEKCLLAMVGDLARRLAIANPSSKTPLQERAIVLIDEIDLHLHPKWQRMVVRKLTKTFPKCQFVITTHSPQVLGEVQARCVRMLFTDPKRGLVCSIPNQALGLDTSEILEELMGTASRNPETADMLAEIFRFIDRDEFEHAKTQIAVVRDRVRGTMPEIVRAESLLTMLEPEQGAQE
jgi:predicted ATP-binding protein involved in virulence